MEQRKPFSNLHVCFDIFWVFNLLYMHYKFTGTGMGNYSLSPLPQAKSSLSSASEKDCVLLYRKCCS